jgi:hypothetical protein
MQVNFSEEEVTLPKATVVGVAEEISPSLVAAINDDAIPADRGNDRSRPAVNAVTNPAKFRQYLQGVLGHLSDEEREVMEPVLNRYNHVFPLDKNSPFKAPIWWSII